MDQRKTFTFSSTKSAILKVRNTDERHNLNFNGSKRILLNTENVKNLEEIQMEKRNNGITTLITLPLWIYSLYWWLWFFKHFCIIWKTGQVLQKWSKQNWHKAPLWHDLKDRIGCNLGTSTPCYGILKDIACKS